MKSRSKSCAVMMAIMVALALTGWGADLKSATDAGEWVWESGTDSLDQSGTYGQLGVASPGNIPGARVYASTWTDRQGAFWLFGGYGYDSAANGGSGDLNDLWKYQGGEWTWMAGSTRAFVAGKVLTKIPSARVSASSWTDLQGNLWLFGGDGFDSTGKLGILNDLWKFSQGKWIWIGGSKLANQFGKYGT